MSASTGSDRIVARGGHFSLCPHPGAECRAEWKTSLPACLPRDRL